MKKSFGFSLAALVFALSVLSGCDSPVVLGGGSPASSKAVFEPVTGITGVPANAALNAAIDLGAAIAVPGDATNRTIAWSLKAEGAGVTAIPEDGVLIPTEKGVFILTAAIADGAEAGLPFMREFSVAVGIPPTTPTELSLAATDGRISATAGGSVGAESYVFRVGTTDALNGAAESASGDLEGLENDLAYYVWVKAQNPFGDSEWFGPQTVMSSAVHSLAADTAAGALAELTAYLAKLPENTPDTAYAVKFGPGVNIGEFWGEEGEEYSSKPSLNDDAVKKLFAAIGTGKYVTVDLSDCLCDYSVNGPISSTVANIIPASGNSGILARPTVGEVKTVTETTYVDGGGTITVVKPNDGNFGGYLAGIVLPDTVKEIGEGFMASNRTLVSVNFPAALQKIGDSAFFETAITSAVFSGGNLTEIGTRAFQECVSLGTVDFAASPLVKIGDGAFARSGIREITLPEGIESFGLAVFAGCVKL
ncbi:MAG: leucine-rich repeat domain-containing protein, partial [Spirochaetaceae bacterium]|nr:leucine-rich repeat domain-containing protein [Spirochaetaceae bacterium]